MALSKADIGEILKMRNEGMTYQQIGEKVGLSRQRIQVLIKRELEYGMIGLTDELYFFVNNCFGSEKVSYNRRVYQTLKQANINSIEDIVSTKKKIEGLSSAKWKQLYHSALHEIMSQKGFHNSPEDISDVVKNCFSNASASYQKRMLMALKDNNLNTIEDVINYDGDLQGISSEKLNELQAYALQLQSM